ncbi:MAG: Fe-S cluster assembly protein SufD [Planctomycetes bacterium]|nr:Fe-S cluster assembly protein SufD [Planctomycetota bacterium]
MTTTMTANNNVESFAAHFQRLEKNDAFARSWFHPVRKAALARFVESGFPTTKDEDWRFTNIKAIKSVDWKSADGVSDGCSAKIIDPQLLEQFGIGTTTATLVFVDGCLAPALSSTDRLPKGVRVERLSDAIKNENKLLASHLGQVATQKDNAFALLNTALVDNGAFIHLAANAVAEKPIHLVFVSTGDQATASHPRTMIIAEDNSQATIVESYIGLDGIGLDGVGLEPATYLTNAVTEVVAGAGANIRHHKIVQESDDAFHFGTLGVSLQRDSRFTSTNICTDGRLTRNNVEARLLGEGGQCTFNGLSMLGGEQLVDNHLYIEHAAAHCESWQYYKGIYNDASHGVFSGRIFVRDGAQKTDAKQTNMTLLLSDRAQIDSKPQLEIFADDVKCTHGATIGQIDEEAIFYLRARGLTDAGARSMMIHAFASQTLNEITVEPLRERLEALVQERLPKG